MVCVADTSVLIDVQYGELVEAVMRLQYTWYAPDLVLGEIEEADKARWLALGLEERTLSGKQIEELFDLAEHYRGASVEDLAALVLAKAEGMVLVAGDGHLRKAAPVEGVEVHGTLWLLDRLRGRNVITKRQAREALEAIRAKGSRQPPDEVEKRLRAWS